MDTKTSIVLSNQLFFLIIIWNRVKIYYSLFFFVNGQKSFHQEIKVVKPERHQNKFESLFLWKMEKAQKNPKKMKTSYFIVFNVNINVCVCVSVCLETISIRMFP